MEAVYYSSANVEDTRQEYFYNELNQCISYNYFWQERLHYRGTYTYDERGREVNEKRVYANGNIASERITEYHADGSHTEYYYGYDSNKQEGMSPPHLHRFIILGMSVLDFMPLKQFLGRTFKAW